MRLGGGARGAEYIFLPLYDIIGLISLGFTMKSITEIIERSYGIKCDQETIRKRIIEFFGGWDEAQQMFLKPVIEALVYDGYDYLDIYRALAGSYLEGKGWVYEWFTNGLDLDFEFWMEQKYLDINRINEIVQNVEKKYCGYARSQWEQWTLEGKTYQQIQDETGLTNSMVRSAFRQFGGKRELLTRYRIRRTIELRKEGWSLKRIYEKEFGLTNFKKHGERDFGKWFERVFPGYSGNILHKIEETWNSKNKANYL